MIGIGTPRSQSKTPRPKFMTFSRRLVYLQPLVDRKLRSAIPMRFFVFSSRHWNCKKPHALFRRAKAGGTAARVDFNGAAG
jgi:hypothetical protein